MAQQFEIITEAQGDAYDAACQKMATEGNWVELEWHQQPDARPFATLTGAGIAEDYIEVEGKTVIVDHITGTVYALEMTPDEKLAELEAIVQGTKP